MQHAAEVYADKARDEDPERAAWLDDQKGAIMTAANVGDLRRVLSGAVEFAQSNNDSAAVDQLNAWANEKRAQAKPKAAA